VVPRGLHIEHMFDMMGFMFADLVDRTVGLTDDALDGRLRDVELAHRRLEAERAALLSAAIARSLPAEHGHPSIKGYVRATTNQSGGIITRQLRIARLVDRLPIVGDALLAGHIGVAQVEVLASAFANRRVGHLLDGVIEVLLDHAEHLPFDDFKVCVDRWVMLADFDGSWRDVEANVAARTAHVVANGSTVDVRASGGDAVTAEGLIKIFERFVEDELRKDLDARRAEHGDDAQGQPLPRTSAQRRFDALAAIFHTAAADTTVGGRPEPVVSIVAQESVVDEAFTRAGLLLANGNRIDVSEFAGVDVDALVEQIAARADATGLVDVRCETASGMPVHPILVLQACLTSELRRVVIDSRSVVVDLGSTQRLFTGSARLAATLLARHCSTSGCLIPSDRCEVDHMVEHCDGGATEPGNAAPKCGWHNRDKHRRRLRSRRARNGRVYDIRSDGTIILPVGERPPDLTADDPDREIHRDAA
jgi:hypothetical protein